MSLELPTLPKELHATAGMQPAENPSPCRLKAGRDLASKFPGMLRYFGSSPLRSLEANCTLGKAKSKPAVSDGHSTSGSCL